MSSRARTAAKVLLGLLALLAVLGAAVLIAAPFVIERVVTSELEKRGIEAVEMQVGTPGPGGTTVRRVRIGQDEAFTADELRVEYSLPALANGRIERIRLVRPRLRLRISDTGEVSFGSLDPLFGSAPADGGAPQLGLPAPLEIVDGAITAATPTGDMTARLEGAVTLEPGAGPLRITLDGPWLSAVAELRMRQEGAGFSVSGRLVDGHMTHPLLSGSFAGPFTAAFGGGTPAMSAELSLSNLRSPALAIGTTAATGNLSAWYERGRIAGDLRLAASRGRLELSLLGDTPQSFRVAFSGEGLGVAEAISDARLEGSFDVDPAARAATLAETATIQGQLAPEWIEAVPAALRPALTEGPLSLTADPGSAISYGPSGLSTSGRLTIAKPDSWELVLDGSVSPQPAASSAIAQMQLSARTVTLAGYALTKLSLQAPIAATFGTGRTEIRLTGPAPLSIGALESGAIRMVGVTVSLQPHEQPLFASGAAGSDFALRAGAAKTEGRFGQDREPFALAWKEAAVQGRPGAMLTAAISGGRIALPRLGWEADRLSARLEADDANPAPAVVTVDIGRLAEMGKQPRLAPIAVKGTLYPTDTAIRFDLRGLAADGQATATVKGSHDLTRGRGSASLILEPLRFAPGKLQPVALVPALGDAVRDATGTLSGGGKVGWSDKGLMSDLEFSLERVGFLSPAGPVLGMTGTVRLNGLAPLSTPPGQRITIDALQAAVPVSDVALQFGLSEGRYLAIEEGRLNLAGGRVSIAPHTLDLEAERNETTWEVAEIQLPILFDLIGLDGLTGTGRLAGTIPLALEKGDVAFRGAELESQEPGVLRYDPAKPPSALQGGGESVGLALAALKNFHYDRLTLKLDREIGGETLVGLHIAGKNPDFYGGYPVEFNLNLSGKLDQILVQGLAGYRLPETIQDQLQKPSAGSSPSPP